MNRNQPAAVIAAQQKLLEAASRQVIGWIYSPPTQKLSQPQQPPLKDNSRICKIMLNCNKNYSFWANRLLLQLRPIKDQVRIYESF